MFERIGLALLLVLSAFLAGCTIAWQGNFSYTYGGGNACAPPGSPNRPWAGDTHAPTGATSALGRVCKL